MSNKRRKKLSVKSRKPLTSFCRVCFLTLFLLGLFSPTIGRHYAVQTYDLSPGISDPLGHLQGSGAPASISWTGDANRISNPSFEDATLMPWIPVQYNAATGSSTTLATTAYDGTKSVQLSLLSGNITTASYVSVYNNLNIAQAGFSSSARFRAAVQLQQLTGTTSSDRIEISLNLTSSIGYNRAIHYTIAPGISIPTNSSADAYYNIGPAPDNQWITIDRDLALDAAGSFPSEYSSFNSVALVTLAVFAQTRLGAPNHDPRIRYDNPNSTLFSHWQSQLPVIYDANNNSVYDSGDTVLGGCNPPPCTPPPFGTGLTDDSLIKYVDSNNNGVWDMGEAVVYDSIDFGGGAVYADNGVYDFYDPVIYGTAPPVGTPLAKVLTNHTTTLFDRIELYTATGGSEWIRNGGFELGLTAWTANSSFTTTAPPVHSGAKSAQGSITNGSIEMTQSIDGRPAIDSSTKFNASANIAAMSGSRSTVDVWVGLVDHNYNPVSLYYVFKTGDGNLPANRTDAFYLKANGFGNLNTWLTVSTSFSQETAAINLLGYSPPYIIELVSVEVVAQGSSSTITAFFDDVSLKTNAHTGTAPSIFYAVSGLNTTYVYTAGNIPQGSLHFEMPRGVSVLNITSPDGAALQNGDYSTSLLATCLISPCINNPRAVDILDSAFFKQVPVGTWRVFATSRNTVSIVQAEDPTSHAQKSNVNVGSTVNFVSRSLDPFGQPLSGVPVNLTLWNSYTGLQVGSWPGSTDNSGWWNVSSVTLPLAGTSGGVYVLQALTLSLYPGIRTFQISARYIVTVTATLSTDQTSAGSTVTISGTVTRSDTSGPATGVNVTVSYRLAGNSQWTALGTTKTDSSGAYALTWNPPEGEYQVMASTGDSQTAPADSSPAHLIVGPASILRGPWLIIIAIVAAAAAAIIVVILLQRRGSATHALKGNSPTASAAK